MKTFWVFEIKINGEISVHGNLSVTGYFLNYVILSNFKISMLLSNKISDALIFSFA